MPREWQRKRSILNHDWLQNRYLVLLQALLGDVAGEFTDEVFERRALGQLIDQWQQHRAELNQLIETCSVQMSPACLLDMDPLSTNLTEDDRGWLAAVTHSCWVARRSLDEQLLETREALQLADRTYKCIRQQVDKFANNCGNVTAASLEGSLERELRTFHEAGYKLSLAISLLPHTLEIT